MSVHGRNRWRGVRCTHRRATETRVSGSLQKAWADASTDLRLELLPITEERAREIFGAEEKIELSAVIAAGVDVRLKDGITPLAGDYSGKNFLCVARRPFHKLAELGFKTTTESFA